MISLPDLLGGWSGAVIEAAIRVCVAVVLALAFHFGVFRLLGRLARMSETRSDDIVFAGMRLPLLWLLLAIAISIAAEGDPLIAWFWDTASRFVVPGLLGWTAFAIVRAFADVLENHAAAAQDEFAARSRRTRIAILSRTAGIIIIFVTVALMLLGIPGVRNIGVTLMASAGLVGLAVGAAAQPALKSLIAGIQMALTEPIRLGDLVVIDGESGRVEDIRLTYAVIRTADERRIIVPTIKFLETSFQNWTRVSGGITGTVTLPVMPGTPIAPVREAYLALLAERPEWDQRSGALHVGEVRVGSIDLRLVMSARDPAALDKLRNGMREEMLEWLRETVPEALCKDA